MSKQKHYLIYQITNLVNGKIYIGKHETYNLEDRYFGSGKYLANAKEKYGLENFEFKILIDLKNKEEMNLLEKMVVTEEFCKRKDTYNINVGGDGGWTYVNAQTWHLTGNAAYTQNETPEMSRQRLLHAAQSSKKRIAMMTQDEYQEFCEVSRQRTLDWYADHPGYFAGENNPMFGHVYTDETLQKMSESHLGEKNHMAQKQWIRNPATHESKTILKTDPIPEGWERGRYCKRK